MYYIFNLKNYNNFNRISIAIVNTKMQGLYEPASIIIYGPFSLKNLRYFAKCLFNQTPC